MSRMSSLAPSSPIRKTQPENLFRLRNLICLAVFTLHSLFIVCRPTISFTRHDSWLGFHPLRADHTVNTNAAVTKGTSDSDETTTPIHGIPPYPPLQGTPGIPPSEDPPTSPPLACSTLPLANDVLLVMKTGATEVSQKLTIHMNTTLACAPNYLIFSDIAETFLGLEIHDALDHMHEYIDKERSADEWRFYTKLQNLSDSRSDADNRTVFETLGKKGQEDAWKLDKFKNLPMLHKAHDMYPNKSWYVFVDADTSIMWSNLLTWLQLLDHNKPIYLGAQNVINLVEFAHGGSGYVLSSAAVKLLANEDDALKTQQMKWAEETCCGDLTVAVALFDHDVRLTKSWPMIQGETPSTLDYCDRHWCYPTVTFHHMSPEEIEAMWKWEQERSEGNARPATYADVFDAFVVESLADEMDGWDNMSTDEEITPKNDVDQMSEGQKLAVESFEGCEKACEEMQGCFQFSFDKRSGKCGLSRSIRLGKKKATIKSGWMLSRIEMYRNERVNCRTEWITS